MAQIAYPPSLLVPAFRVRTVQFTLVAGQTTRVVVANPNRVALIFWPVSAGTYLVGPDSAVTSGTGFTVSSTVQQMIWKFSDFGAMVGGEWYASPSGVGIASRYTEVIYVPVGEG